MKAKKGPARAYSCKRGHRLDYKTRYTSPLGNSKCRKCAALHIKHMQKKQGKVYQLAKKLIADVTYFPGSGTSLIGPNGFELIEQIRKEVNAKLI